MMHPEYFTGHWPSQPPRENPLIAELDAASEAAGRDLTMYVVGHLAEALVATEGGQALWREAVEAARATEEAR